MPFGGLKLTNFGLNLNSKAQAGKKLTLTRVAVGDGTLGSGSVYSMTGLISERVSFPISDVRANGDTSSIIFRMTNSELEEGFFYREIGVYAKDPDTLAEGIYLYDNCRSDGEYIGDKTDMANRVNVYMRLKIKFAQTDQIIFDASGDPMYVLYDEFMQYVHDYNERFTAIESLISAQEVKVAANTAAIAGHTAQLAAHDTAISALEASLGTDSAALAAHAADLVKHVTAAERAGWNAKGTANTATYTAVLPASGWSGAAPYTQTVAVAGILAADRPHITRVLSGSADQKRAQQEAWNMVSDADAQTGGILFTCLDDRPGADLSIQIEVMRNG